MPTEPVHLAVIIGSIRPGRFGPTPGRWIAEQAVAHEAMQVDVIDLADFDLVHQLRGFTDPLPESMDALGKRLAAADAFIVVTPEYNHSYPAGLKTAIDWYAKEWQAKPVAFVSYGGLAGGLRAVEHLRGIFPEVHAVTMRETVSFHNFWEKFDEEGKPLDETVTVAAKTMLDQLLWWALTLREGRAARPYGG